MAVSMALSSTLLWLSFVVNSANFGAGSALRRSSLSSRFFNACYSSDKPPEVHCGLGKPLGAVAHRVILHHCNNDIEWMAEAKAVNVHREDIMDTALLDVVLIIPILNFLTDEDTKGDVGVMIMPHNNLISVHGH